MKKGLLLFLGMLMMVSTVEATGGKLVNSTKGYYNYIGARPIKFVERGIKFYIYPNGEVDFNSTRHYRTQYYYRNGRRYKKRIATPRALVDYDFRGRLRSVGNVFIGYNRFGKVTRVGSVFIDYHRGRRLKRVGGLSIRYDRSGRVRYFGQVKPRFGFSFDHNDYYYDGYIYNYDDRFFYSDDFYNGYESYGEDNDYYYYRSKRGNGIKKGKGKVKVIKRKKLKKAIFEDDDTQDRKRRR